MAPSETPWYCLRCAAQNPMEVTMCFSCFTSRQTGQMIPQKFHVSPEGISHTVAELMSDSVILAKLVLALQAELTVARQDTARVDWLEKMSLFPIEIDNHGIDTLCFLTINSGEEDRNQYGGKGLRAVIDFATLATKTPPRINTVTPLPERSCS